jgi:hypothetical protein
VIVAYGGSLLWSVQCHWVTAYLHRGMLHIVLWYGEQAGMRNVNGILRILRYGNRACDLRTAAVSGTQPGKCRHARRGNRTREHTRQLNRGNTRRLFVHRTASSSIILSPVYNTA